MNYLLFRRLRGPIYLLTFGVTALLNEWNVLSFSRSWPLYLIVFGVVRLIEGAAFASLLPATLYPGPGFSSTGYAAQGYPPVAPAPGVGLATVAPAPIQTSATPEEES